MKKLYKRTSNGSIQQWSVEVEGNKYRTHEGLQEGKITISEWTTCKAKSIGKKNETTGEEQAIKEANAKYSHKLDHDYWEDINDIDKKRYFSPMLAHKWKDYRTKIEYPMLVQRKLDGIRCLASKDGLFSRKGKRIVSVPHIWESVKPFFEEYPEIILDGEIYNHELKNDFNTITSIVRKQKPTKEDLEKSELLAQYHIYDIYNANNPSEDNKFRLEILLPKVFKAIGNKYIIFVGYDWISSEEELQEYHTKFVSEGYEGIMLRNPKAAYDEGKRSKNLLKKKDFLDDEFLIIDIQEGSGNRSNMMGRIVLETKEGKIFSSNARGNQAYYKELLENKQQYRGLKATVRFQEYTPDGIPRFPVVISIRNYE